MKGFIEVSGHELLFGTAVKIRQWDVLGLYQGKHVIRHGSACAVKRKCCFNAVHLMSH